VQAELVTNEPLLAAVQADPRASSGMGSALHSESFSKAPAQPPGRAGAAPADVGVAQL
jgi:hypothetical protein